MSMPASAYAPGFAFQFGKWYGNYADLVAYNGGDGKPNGRHDRYLCPIHGGDHQLSLSIMADGDGVGFGTCHNCRASVSIRDYPGRTATAHKRVPLAERAANYAQRKQRKTPQNADQQAELADLQRVRLRMMECLNQERAVRYIAGRGLDVAPDDLSLAQFAGIGYIPDTAKFTLKMGRWIDRIMFPLWSPDGVGYVGRALWGWQPGMDEAEHKRILDEYADRCKSEDRYNERLRWIKTNPAGWYGPASDDLADTVYICEGPFDRLAYLACGFDLCETVALVGTACPVEWFPRQVKRVILDLDNDTTGQERAQTIKRELKLAGITTLIAERPDDGLGKDPSERYRRAGIAGMAYIFAAYERLEGRTPAATIPISNDIRTAIYDAPAPIVAPENAATLPEWEYPNLLERPATIPTITLDRAKMRALFERGAPWYDPTAPDNAASQAALYVCEKEIPPPGYRPSTMPQMMAVYAALLVAFDRGEPVTLNRQGVTAPIPLILAVSLLREAYKQHSTEAAHYIVAALRGDIVVEADAMKQIALSTRPIPNPDGASWSHRLIAEYMAQGISYFDVVARVRTENLARLGT